MIKEVHYSHANLFENGDIYTAHIYRVQARGQLAGGYACLGGWMAVFTVVDIVDRGNRQCLDRVRS